mmetsp:Transcript_5999/g.14311  ORF Transcript_5999/g.14311 Transcript_5999/m.14311 type:complete len:420 (-) Transcript_5999:1042-2301(-)
MTVLHPAMSRVATASFTPSLGGSSKPTKPNQAKPSMGKLASCGPVPFQSKSSGMSRRYISAKQSTRRPPDIKRYSAVLISPRRWSVRSQISAWSAACLHKARTRSGAPFKINRNTPGETECTVNIHLLSELKGISNTRGFCSWYSWRSSPMTRQQASRMATSVGLPVSWPSGFTLQVLFSNPHWARCKTVALATGVCHSSAVQRHMWISLSHKVTMSVAVMHPAVRVPVLSEHRTFTQPKVSMASILRTRTFCFTIRREAIIRLIVTVGSRPSGTWAKKAVAALPKILSIPRCTGDITLATRDKRPTANATKAMMCTKCSICTSKDDRVRVAVVILAAICPKNVWSPVRKTMPCMRPLTTVVPKKQTLRASMIARVGPSGVVLRGSGNDSPVSAALSTSAPSVQKMMRRSAGTFSPASN